jgi:hypothetical protein
LKHIYTTNELPATQLEDLDGTEDMEEMFVDDETHSDAETVEEYSDNDSVL